MKVSISERAGARIVACDEAIESVDEALSLISACIENDTPRLLIDATHLPPAFLVSGPERSERFEEFLREARRGRDFRAFTSREDAEIWLVSA